jgi:hypothetical protein
MTELLRFYEDLGIIPNRGTAFENNDNLLQGQQYMEHRRYNKRHVKTCTIEGLTTLTGENTNSNYVTTSISKKKPKVQTVAPGPDQPSSSPAPIPTFQAPSVPTSQVPVAMSQVPLVPSSQVPVAMSQAPLVPSSQPPVPTFQAPLVPSSQPPVPASAPSSKYKTSKQGLNFNSIFNAGPSGSATPNVNFFNQMDTNKDSKLGREEVQSWFQKERNMNTPERLFEQDDINLDNNISWDEFTGPKGIVPPKITPTSSNTTLATAPKNMSATASTPLPAQVPSCADTTTPLTSNISNCLDNTNKYSSGEINLDATTFQPVNNDRRTIEGRRDNSILETRSIKFHYIAWIVFAIFVIWAIFSISSFSFSGVNFSTEFQPTQDNSNVFSMFVMVILFFGVIVIFNQFNSSSVKTTVRIYDNSNNNNNNNNGKKK